MISLVNKKIFVLVGVAIGIPVGIGLVLIVLFYPSPNETWKSWRFNQQFKYAAPKPEWWSDVDVSCLLYTSPSPRD